MPEGVPHYDATITVFRVVDGKTERVCEPWRGVFTDGKCYEDNLADLVAKALKTANAEAHGRRSRTVQPIVGSSSEDTE
jgi:hypothetical protein